MQGKENNSCVTLFFDDENPVLKELLKLDYFEYERIKKLQPELLDDIYSQDEVEVFDSIIEPYSESGANFHIRGRIPECDWSAIPGGIPPYLVNGICICKIECTKEYIEKISELFPNATIFDYDKNIVKIPEKTINDEKGKNEINISENNVKSIAKDEAVAVEKENAQKDVSELEREEYLKKMDTDKKQEEM